MCSQTTHTSEKDVSVVIALRLSGCGFVPYLEVTTFASVQLCDRHLFVTHSNTKLYATCYRIVNAACTCTDTTPRRCRYQSHVVVCDAHVNSEHLPHALMQCPG